MAHVVVTDYPMIDPETYRTTLDGVATVSVATVDDVDDLIEVTADADAAVVDVTVPVPERVFEARPGLRVVARSSVGVEGVDLDAAEDADVTVLHAPEYCVDEVATHAVALLLAGVRALPEFDGAVRAGEWPRTADRPLHRLRGSTLGLVSYGTIARAVRERVRGFDLDVVAYDPYVDAAVLDGGVERVGRDELFDRADHVSVHAPETPETRELVDADALTALPDHAVVVNVGRGAVVDEDALVAALDAGTIGAAGLDVFETEPLPADSSLREFENVVLTPHVGWYSETAHEEVNHTVATDVRRALTGETPENVVTADWR